MGALRLNGFLGNGARDTKGLRAFLQVGQEVAAVDLSSGALLWRRGKIGRPVAASPSRLVTLDRDGRLFVLRMFDAVTGADSGRVSDLGMPDLAIETGMARDAVRMEAFEHPEGVELVWQVRSPYRGGAAPPARIAARAANGLSTGVLLLDVAKGRAEKSAEMAISESVSGEAPDLGPFAAPAAGVLAYDRIGDRLYVMKAPTDPGRPLVVTLEARDARDGSTVWETSLGELERERPMPLRKLLPE